MKKKVDSRIQTLLDNASKTHQRAFFLIIGDRGRDQVVNLHYVVSKNMMKSKPKLLWCYKKELGFSTHKKQRMKEIQKLQKKGLYNPNSDEPFELFTSSNEIRYCYYKESHKILGNTFTMLVLQDFESITPNILCRTIETVEGGGIVIMLIKTMNSLKQLYTLSMDVHQRYRTEAYQDVEPRFNERFILSLSTCKNCIVMDDELNILPISSLINEIVPITNDQINSKIDQELADLKKQVEQNALIGPLVKITKTLDQAKAVMVFAEAISEKNFRCTVSLTAGRGRGKSAAIGLSISAAIACGFSNIFVTAPSPENLKTLFDFIFMGLEALGYKENLHYEIIQSTNPEFNNSVIRININKTHRQIVQYILPSDYDKLGQADLVVIDEAAAIPLIFVKKFLGPYIVFLSSTINGYEGTGRSLSLKLIQKLREQNKIISENKGEYKSATGSRILKEITLNDPIRYSLNDPIEKWLNDLLLLNATNAESLKQGLPHPNDCELFLVNRDTLFSYHKSTEKFLFSMMSLFISSHYKNSPNDLQLMSDAPAHILFVLLGPIKNDESNKNSIPDILCVVQVCLEGQIHKESVMDKNQRSMKPAGDLIPWTISEQYQDPEFPSLNGARVVRIATHPGAQKMGYGTRALELLTHFFEGEMIDLSNESLKLDSVFLSREKESVIDNSNPSLEVMPKKKLKPILKKLTEVKPPFLHYLGVSYGLTKELFKFWRKNDFHPLYLRQSKNDLTAEHTCIMVKQLKRGIEGIEEGIFKSNEWLSTYEEDFKRRFLSLMAYEFKDMEIGLSLGVLDPYLTTNINEEEINQNEKTLLKNEIEIFINLYDLKRLEAYSKNMVDFHLVIDLLPHIARLFFEKKFPKSLRFSYSQAAILIGIGLQHKSVEIISNEINLPVGQILALFNKSVRKVTNYIKSLYIKEAEKEITNKNIEDINMAPLKNKLDQEVLEEGKDFLKHLENKNLKKQNENQNLLIKNLKRKANANFDIANIADKEIESAFNKVTDTLTIKREEKGNKKRKID